MWAAAEAVEQLMGLCDGAAFPDKLFIMEPPVPVLLSLALTVGGSSCRILGCKGFML